MIRFSRRDKQEHNYFEERLSAYLDGELAARERRAVEQHLKGCEACRRDLATLKQTVAWLSELPTVPLPRAFTIPANVVPAPAVRRRRWTFVPAMQFATALVAVLLFFAAAGDVMLTGWPWGTAGSEPVMLQEAAFEQPAAEMPAAKEVEVTLEVEAPMSAQPYGAGGLAVTVPAAEPPGMEPGAEVVAAEAPEEAPMALQQAPTEAAARAGAPTEPALDEGLGGAGTGEQELAVEDTARAEADASPLLPSESATGELPAGTREPLPTVEAESMPTEVPVPTLTATLEPAAVVVPTPTALPTIHSPVREAMEPPTAIVQAREPLPQVSEMRDEAESAALTSGESWAVLWLRIVEYVLGIALVVLVAATIVLMALRRRARGR